MMENLMGVAEFSEDQLQRMNQKIDEAGVPLPSFSRLSTPSKKSSEKIKPVVA